jgi:hypothetical protein
LHLLISGLLSSPEMVTQIALLDAGTIKLHPVGPSTGRVGSMSRASAPVWAESGVIA